jgi:hypothetical protein
MKRNSLSKNTFASSLAARMKARKVDSISLSHACGISRKRIEHLQTGLTLPNGVILKCICDALRIPFTDAKVRVDLDRLERRFGNRVWKAAAKAVKINN